VLTATEAWDDAALTALIAGATLLGTDLKCGLYTNTPFTPTKSTVLSDLTEPTYGSYVRQAVVMGPIFRDPQNGIASIGAGLVWQETGTFTPEIIQGVFYTYGAGPTLLGVDPFQNPIPLTDLLSAFTTVLEYISSNNVQGFTTVLQ
jgi:hypothetical protein